MKVRTTLTIDKDVINEAKSLGINISQFCETALKEAIKRLKEPGFPPITRNKPKIVPLAYDKNNNNKNPDPDCN